MLSTIKRIGTTSSYYLFGQLAISALGFFLIPIYTRVLTPGDYGTITVVTATISIFAILLELGLRGALSTFYFDYHKDPEQIKRYISTIVLFLLPYSLLTSLIIAGWGGAIVQPLIEGIPFFPYVALALGIAFCEMFFLIAQTIYQVQEKASKFAIFNIIYVIVNLALTIYFVVFLRRGALGNTEARFIASIAFFAISIYLIKDFLVLRFDVPKLLASIKFGLPLVPHSLSGWILTAVDRLLLNQFSGLSSVGLFSLGAKISDFMNLFTVSINNAWAPFFISTLKEHGDQAKGLFARLTTYCLALFFFLGLALSITAREIVSIVATPQYHEAYHVIPIMTFGWVLAGMYYFVVNQIFYAKKTRLLPLATFSAGGIQLLLNYIWIPKYGIVGAAWAMFVAQLFSFLFTWFISYKVYPITFEYLRIIKIILMTIGLLLVGFSIDLDWIWMSLLVKGILLLSYPLILFVIGFYSSDELLQARAVLSHWFAGRQDPVRS